MHCRHAITRIPAETVANGLTTAHLGSPDFKQTLKQHQAYCTALEGQGIEVQRLTACPEFPDGHFVEDTAVVVKEAAVIARPGADARRDETQNIRTALSPYRPLFSITPPGTLDGGDVLVAGKKVFIGISDRTNAQGAQQLAHILSRFDYQCVSIPVTGGLHLKSCVNIVGTDTLLVTQAFAHHDALRYYKKIVVDNSEAYAANTLWINDHLIMPDGFPQTREQLEKSGLEITVLDVSEFGKMDGGLTCLSLRF